MSEVKGKLIVKGQTIVVSEKFSKRSFVVETNDTYPQVIEMQLSQDKCGLLDSINVGDEINVSLNLRGRSWTNPQGEVKYFNTLEAWKIDKLGVFTTAPQAEAKGVSNVESDLPF
jgi:hypothetical protein